MQAATMLRLSPNEMTVSPPGSVRAPAAMTVSHARKLRREDRVREPLAPRRSDGHSVRISVTAELTNPERPPGLAFRYQQRGEQETLLGLHHTLQSMRSRAFLLAQIDILQNNTLGHNESGPSPSFRRCAYNSQSTFLESLARESQRGQDIQS